jgi:hypothetical protein
VTEPGGLELGKQHFRVVSAGIVRSFAGMGGSAGAEVAGGGDDEEERL